MGAPSRSPGWFSTVIRCLMRTLPAWALQGDDDAAGVAFADALGTDVFAISEGDVNDAAFVRRHSLERNRAAIVAHLLRDAQGKRAQVFLAALTVVFGVNDDAHAVLGAMADDEAHQQLER